MYYVYNTCTMAIINVQWPKYIYYRHNTYATARGHILFYVWLNFSAMQIGKSGGRTPPDNHKLLGGRRPPQRRPPPKTEGSPSTGGGTSLQTRGGEPPNFIPLQTRMSFCYNLMSPPGATPTYEVIKISALRPLGVRKVIRHAKMSEMSYDYKKCPVIQ